MKPECDPPEVLVGRTTTASGSVFDVGYRQDEIGWVVFARRRSDREETRLLWTLTRILAEKAARRWADEKVTSVGGAKCL